VEPIYLSLTEFIHKCKELLLRLVEHATCMCNSKEQNVGQIFIRRTI